MFLNEACGAWTTDEIRDEPVIRMYGEPSAEEIREEAALPRRGNAVSLQVRRLVTALTRHERDAVQLLKALPEEVNRCLP